MASLDFFSSNQFGEMLERSIVSGLRFLRETAAGQLTISEMIGQTFTADPLTVAGIIGTIASAKIFLFFAFHGVPSLRIVFHLS